MTDTTTVESPVERRARKERPERAMTEPEPVVEAASEPVAEGPTPEAALAEAKTAIEQRDRELEAERQKRQQAEQQATRAQREAQRAQASRAQDREIVLGSAIEAATSERANAISALRTAREAGDLDAEIKAQEALSGATYRLAQANGELAAVKAAKGNPDPTSAAGPVAEQPQRGGYSAATQAWIDRHRPLWDQPRTRQNLIDMHNTLINDGVVPESPAYFRALDEAAAALEDGMKPNGGTPKKPTFNGAPPSRSGAGHGGGASTVKTLLGPVTVTRRNDGKVGIQIPPHLRADFEEGAKVAGMSLGDYAFEQVKIAEEREAGGDGGLITEEGRSYR